MTANRIVYVILLIITIFLIIFLPSRISYLFFYITILLPIASILFCLISYKNITLSQACEKSAAFQGEKIFLNIKITNKDFFLYPYVNLILSKNRIIEGLDSPADIKNNIYSISPRGVCKIDAAFNFVYRGNYHFGATRIEIMDYLGLIKLKKKISCNNFIIVYPHFDKIKRFSGINDGTGTVRTASFANEDNYAEISGVRKYDYSDEMKKIHWKLSSKKNELLVKTYSSASDNNAAIIIDLYDHLSDYADKVAVEDKIISSTLSVIDHCLYSNIFVKLILYNNYLTSLEAQKTDDFYNIYQTLSSVYFNSQKKLENILQSFSNEYKSFSNLILITDYVNNSLCDSLIEINLSHTNVSLVYIINNSANDVTSRTYLEYLQNENIYCLPVDLSLSISSLV